MPMIDLTTLTSRSAIEAQLATLTTKESILDTTLTSLISSRTKLTEQLNALAGLREVVSIIQDKADEMAARVGDVAETAERVGGKVRILDEEQSRVKASIEVVQSVQDLKTSISNLDTSIQKEDWEAATRYMQRVTAIDPEIIASGFAEAVVPTSNLPLAPPQTIATLRATLLEIFLNSFRTASSTGDTNNINRFFKLFPMIGEEDAGLDVYADWVGGVVRSKTGALAAKSQSPTHFSSLLTTLFESIALIISQHQPVVEKYYGSGKMLAVASKLILECDRLGLRVLTNWEEERRIRKKLNETKEYRFPGLARKRAGRGNESIGGEDEEKMDAREVDALLAEMAQMSGRWELLRRFLYDRLRDSDDDLTPLPTPQISDVEEPNSPLIPPPTPTIKSSASVIKREEEEEEESNPQLEMVEKSELGISIRENLKNIFEPMEVWYLRSSIDKAHQMDELDLSSYPFLSSSLDDTFYILKKTFYRLLSASSIDTLCSTCKEVKRIMERDVAEVWKGVMEGAFKDVLSSGGTSGIGGRSREEEKEKREKEARDTFVVYLNNLDTAGDYTIRLIDEMLSGDLLNQAFFLDQELESARIAILGVRSVEDKFRSVLKSGLDHLFNQLLRPRLRPILSEVYKDVSYVLNEDGYAESEYRDDVRKRFVKAWEVLLSGYRDSLTPSNFTLFFSTAVDVLVRPWEGMIRSMKFTELGALRLDKDLRSILSYLSTQSPFASGSLRESFSRLQQIATLLTLDTREEADEAISATGNRLTGAEVGAVWALRV